MRSLRVCGVFLALALPVALSGQARSAQAGSARLVAFTNEPREPEFGEVFQLEVQVRIAPDVVAFLSDTLAEAENSVSAGSGTWTVAPGPADSMDVRAAYPVMGLLPGGVELPLIELWTRPAGPEESAGVRVAQEASATELEAPGVEHALLYLGGVFIMPPAEMTGDDAMLMPRPPADVLGGERSPWLVAGVLVAALAALVAAWLLLAGRFGSSGSSLPAVLSPRAEALRELDRIREMGWHENGRIVDFYDATTGVLRHYAERREPAEWRTALTSTELIDRLGDHWGTEVVEPLRPTIWTAECVKFGGRQPGSEAAEADWSRVREWIASGTDDR
jgi:hypothetical protein